MQPQEPSTSYEASQLGFPPGVWPSVYVILGKKYVRMCEVLENDELVAMRYINATDGNDVIEVFND